MSACNKSACAIGGNDTIDLVAMSRRKFMGSVASAVATVTLAPGITVMAFGGSAKADDHRARWGLLIDVNKCSTDCDACVKACSTENGWKEPVDLLRDAQWIRKVTLKDRKTGFEQSLPVMCQHCAEPPCVDVCPTAASFKRDDGIVLVDKHLCIGCRYCMMACPYQARSFIHEPLTGQKEYAPRGIGTVESCTLCVHRVDVGGTPACVEACDATGNGAMMFGNLNDPESAIAKRIAEFPSTQIRADLGLDPGVRYENL